jgi:hypothetical protein
MKKKWFAVKTLYYQEAIGRAKVKDRFYLKSSVTLEERIVLFFSESFEKAIKLAEKEAKGYAKPTYENPLGEMVHTKYSGCYDAFELFEEPGHGIEVFSEIDLYLTKAEMRKALKIKLGISHGSNDAKYMMRFRYK